MGWAELLLLVLVGWTIVGAFGVAASYRRGEQTKAGRHLAWIGGVWVLYLVTLLGISVAAAPRSIKPAQEQCFHSLCFAVLDVKSMPGYLAGPGEHLLRLSIRMTNHSRKDPKGDSHLTAYLVDSRNRHWDEIPGLEGIRLSTTVPADKSLISTPVFKVASDAKDLRLVFTHGRRLPYLLLLGDRDSLLHPPTFVPLGVPNE